MICNQQLARVLISIDSLSISPTNWHCSIFDWMVKPELFLRGALPRLNKRAGRCVFGVSSPLESNQMLSLGFRKNSPYTSNTRKRFVWLDSDLFRISSRDIRFQQCLRQSNGLLLVLTWNKIQNLLDDESNPMWMNGRGINEQFVRIGSIMLTWERGFVNLLANSFTSTRETYWCQIKSKQTARQRPLKLADLAGAFILLGIGLSSSFLVFLLELVAHGSPRLKSGPPSQWVPRGARCSIGGCSKYCSSRVPSLI